MKIEMTIDRYICPSERWFVLAMHKFRCVYCGTTSKESRLEIDHMISIDDGGTNEITNLVPSCFSCNRGKGKVSVFVHPWRMSESDHPFEKPVEREYRLSSEEKKRVSFEKF